MDDIDRVIIDINDYLINQPTFLSNTITGMSSLGPYIGNIPSSIYNAWAGRYGNLRRPSRRRRRRGRARGGFASKVKKIIAGQGELKYINATLQGTVPVAGASVISLLSGVAQGDTDQTRDGEKIYLHSIQIKGALAGDVDQVIDTPFRLILFRQNTNCEGVLPVVSDILTTDSHVSLKPVDNRGEYTTLWNFHGLLKIADPTISPQVLVSYYKKYKTPKVITYDGADNLIASCEKGHLFMCVMCNAVDTKQMTTDLDVRLTFKEM